MRFGAAERPDRRSASARPSQGGKRLTRPSYLPDYLTGDQLRAILHHGSPLLIIAGPGSGKTEVITLRVVHLVRAGLIEPEQLLVATFTNKAADQLKDRIQKRLPEINVESMQVSTMHSFCARLLRDHADSAGLPAGFQILDAEAQLLFVYARREPLGLSDLIKGRENAFFEEVVSLFNHASEELVSPKNLEAWCIEQGELGSEDEKEAWEERARVGGAYGRYADLLREARVVDFAHLQRFAYDLLQGDQGVLEATRDQFRELLIDEYQDTNAVQDRLLKLIEAERGCIAAVGDDDQSIYRFRGATVANLLKFPERFPGATEIKLEDNFRSLVPIVSHSTEVIRCNPARFDKSLRSVRGASPANEVLLVYEHDCAAEASAMVDFMQRLKRAGRLKRYGDIAILLRSVRSYADPYLVALSDAGIPYNVIGDGSFFDRDEISELYDLFSFLSASKAWGDRFLRSDLVGLRHETRAVLKDFKGFLMEIDFDSPDAEPRIPSKQDRRKLATLHELKRRVQAKEHRSLLEVVYELLAITGCMGRFEAAGDAEALSNLGVMTQLVANWDLFGHSRNFYAFQHYLKLLREGGIDPVVISLENAVQVMTIHQAKGLEFPVVVLGAAMNGRLPARRRADRYPVPYVLRASGEPEVQDPHLVDERKLFYVASTRARDLLIVGTADVVNKRGGGPSPFVYEMFGEDLSAMAKASEDRVEAIEEGKPAPRDLSGRYSFSDLAYYLQCPLRYKFARLYGFQAPWLDPVDFGANVHRALDVIHRRAISGDPAAAEEVEDIVREVWSSGAYLDEGRLEGFQKAAAKQIQRYLSAHADDLARAERSEGNFKVEVADRLIGGKFDLLRSSPNGDGVEVVDFKTSGAVDLEEQGIDLQLALYAYGVEDRFGLDVAGCTAHFLGDGHVETVPWTEEGRTEAQRRLAEILERIEAEDFPPNTRYCADCSEFNRICPESAVAEGEPR